MPPICYGLVGWVIGSIQPWEDAANHKMPSDHHGFLHWNWVNRFFCGGVKYSLCFSFPPPPSYQRKVFRSPTKPSLSRRAFVWKHLIPLFFFFHLSELIGLFTHEKLAQMTNIRRLCPRRPIDHYACLLMESRHKWNHDDLLMWVSSTQLPAAHKHPGLSNK